MTVQEAARRLELAPTTVYSLCRAGLLAHRRVGVGRGVLRISEADLGAYLASTRVEARAPGPGAPPPLSMRNPLDVARAERERRRITRGEPP